MTIQTPTTARGLAIDMVRVTEETALAVSPWMGKGDERAADRAAAVAMHAMLAALELSGTVVVGEGERGQVDLLYVGETLGLGGPPVDIALDALEGTNICARGVDNALAVVAVAENGGFLSVPSMYMEKIAVGPGYPEGVVDLTRPPEDNVRALAEAKGCRAEELLVCILDRPRHEELIGRVRDAGARIRLISDGDVAGVVATTHRDMGVDLYMGIGGATEGVLAAAALRATGGQMQGRLVVRTDDQRAILKSHGIDDPARVYKVGDMARGDVTFAATGITGGSFLRGVRHAAHSATTHSLVMRSRTGTVRYIETMHDLSRKHTAAPDRD